MLGGVKLLGNTVPGTSCFAGVRTGGIPSSIVDVDAAGTSVLGCRMGASEIVGNAGVVWMVDACTVESGLLDLESIEAPVPLKKLAIDLLEESCWVEIVGDLDGMVPLLEGSAGVSVRIAQKSRFASDSCGVPADRPGMDVTIGCGCTLVRLYSCKESVSLESSGLSGSPIGNVSADG